MGVGFKDFGYLPSSADPANETESASGCRGCLASFRDPALPIPTSGQAATATPPRDSPQPYSMQSTQTNIYIYMYIHIYTHIHTYVHTQAQRRRQTVKFHHQLVVPYRSNIAITPAYRTSTAENSSRWTPQVPETETHPHTHTYLYIYIRTHTHVYTI